MNSIILGVDPGTRVTGYALISVVDNKYKVIDFGCIRPPPTLDLPKRYLIIFNAMESLIKKYHPRFLAVETQFVGRNPQSAIKLGMARGSIILAAEKNGVTVHEYSPRKAKLSIAGNGSASKFQVQRRVQMLLSLSQMPEPEDAADALAIAVCHAHTLNFKGGLCTNL